MNTATVRGANWQNGAGHANGEKTEAGTAWLWQPGAGGKQGA